MTNKPFKCPIHNQEAVEYYPTLYTCLSCTDENYEELKAFYIKTRVEWLGDAILEENKYD